MSRLKLKVNNCLLNNKEFFKLFNTDNSIFNKIGYNCFIIFQDYLNIKILKYNENFEILWNFWVLKFYIFFSIFKFSNFLKLLNFKFWPPTDSISTPLPMEYRPPYPWYIDPPYLWYFDPPCPWYIEPLTHGTVYIDPPIHGILIPLHMIFWPPCISFD